MCDSKESIFINEHEENRVLSKIGIKTPLIKIILLGDILFYKLPWWILLIIKDI